MALKTLVKVGEVNNLSDARYCAGMGVDIIGFIFSHKERQAIAKEEYIAITSWLEGPQFVAEFDHSSDEEIESLAEELKFDFVQVSDASQAARLQEKGLKVIYSHDPENGTTDLPPCYYLLLDSSKEIELRNDLLNEFSNEHEVLLGIGVSLETLDHLISETEISGIHLKGNDEIRPGYKDYDELTDILEALEND